MKRYLLGCLLPAFMAFIPIGKQRPANPAPHPEFTQSHNDFAFRLLKTVLQTDTSSNNKVISPLSLYLNLSMLYNGAAHETRASIARTLSAEGIDLPNLNSECKQLLQQMPIEDSKVRLQITGSLWYNQHRLTLSPIYESLISNFYYSPIIPTSFSGKTAVEHINHWVDQNTGHQIPDILQQTSSGDWMYLLSAFAFKGDWLSPFEPAYTHDADFYVHPGLVRTVPMMEKTDILHTYADTSFTMVELPCGAGDTYSLLVFLPEDEQMPVSKWMSSFSSERLGVAMDKMTDQWVKLSLPRWESNYSVENLKPVLENMGMTNAFPPAGEADFTNLFSAGGHKACLSQVIQRNAIRVNENGLQAAPVPAGVLTPAAAPSSRHSLRVIDANRPFFYALVEKQRSVVLLAGIVNDPSGIKEEKPTQKAPAPRHRFRLKRH